MSFLQGKYRYFFYYRPKLRWLIRDHIREQIDWRISIMDKDCLNNGECKLCGCQTTALQMANKPCKKPCYPRMLSKKDWNHSKEILKN